MQHLFQPKLSVSNFKRDYFVLRAATSAIAQLRLEKKEKSGKIQYCYENYRCIRK